MTISIDPEVRYDWRPAEIEAIYTLPSPQLLFRAQAVHRAYHRPDAAQGCALLSVKTGGCPEDCAYCPQSALFRTAVARAPLMRVEQASVEVFELVRMIAVARILMPASMARLSAGRLSLSDEAQALCFVAGANSIFIGERLLTTPNPETDRDRSLLNKLGLHLLSPIGGSDVDQPSPAAEAADAAR